MNVYVVDCIFREIQVSNKFEYEGRKLNVQPNQLLRECEIGQHMYIIYFNVT